MPASLCVCECVRVCEWTGGGQGQGSGCCSALTVNVPCDGCYAARVVGKKKRADHCLSVRLCAGKNA